MSLKLTWASSNWQYLKNYNETINNGYYFKAMVRKHHYNFRYWVNMLNIRWGGFDHAQYSAVLLDIWWDMLIKFSKQIANSFAKINNGYKGE